MLDLEYDIQDLKQLLEAPNEKLDLELKTWLDLRDKGHQGTLAKALIALANHGGGIVTIGFNSEGEPTQDRPSDLSSYSQDAVNDVLDRFADPCFHCTVQMVTRTNDGLEYPVILAPGGHKVPIRSKRASPGNEIQADRYYIRRPGPASEMPQGGGEWGELIRRCVRNNTDEIVSLVRDVLEGRPPKADAAPDTADRLTQWDEESVARWGELINRFPPNSHVRMPNGNYHVAAVVEDINLDVHRLREAMRRAKRRLTGWPPWLWLTQEGCEPYVHENTIECHIKDWPFHPDAAHSDFWRVSTTGQLFVIRGYNEDSLKVSGRVTPGSVLDITLPIWRIGECLLFIQRFATEADAENSTVSVLCQWSGLQGRELTTLSGRRDLFRIYRSRSDAHTAKVTIPAARISGALPEIVRDLVNPLYALFDFFEPPTTIFAEELGRMLRRES